MKSIYDDMREKIPYLVTHLLMDHNGALVGGSVRDLIENGVPKDYDVIVPPSKWREVSRALLAHNATLNPLGGIKVARKGKLSIDVWPTSLQDYIRNLPGAPFIMMTPNLRVFESRGKTL